jgi:Fem-1 family protein b
MATEVIGSVERRHFDRRPVLLLTKIVSVIEKGNIVELRSSVSNSNLRKCLEEALREPSQPQSRSPLVLAARNNKEQIVKYLLKEFKYFINLEQESTVNIDLSNIEGATALWTSATLGFLPIVKLLVKAGARVDHGTRSKSTPLRGAAYDGHLDVVRYLTEQGANIHTANHCGQSPLGIAAAMKKIDCTKYLISKGAHINDMGQGSDTPLHIAVESGDMEVCKVLLKAGAKNLANSLGHTPCMLASCHGHDKVAEHLMKVFNVDVGERYNCYLLLGARKSMMAGEEALVYWTKALDVKQKSHGIILEYCSPHEVYEGVKEPSTRQELEEIIRSTEKTLALCAVIFERVLGAAHPSTAFTMRGFGDLLIECKKYAPCEEVWLRSLEYDKAARLAFELQVVEDLLFAVKGFDTMCSDGYYPHLTAFVEWGLLELEMARESKTSELEISCALCKLLAVWIKVIDSLEQEGCGVRVDKERTHFKSCVQLLITKCKSCKTACMPLVACLSNFKKDDPIYKAIYNLDLPLHRVLQSLIDHGASVLDFDGDRQFPLHAAVKMRSKMADECVDVLVTAGAPLYVSDYLGRTALDLAKQSDTVSIDHMEQLYRGNFTLQSMTAVAVVTHHVEYKRFALPQHLMDFLSWH